MNSRSLNRSIFFLLLFICIFCFTGTVYAQGGRFSNVNFEGILTEDNGPSICLQGGLAIRDCQGNILVRVTDSGNSSNLINLLGQYVRVSGEDIGVECAVLDVTKLRVLANSCSQPQPNIGGRKEGIVQQNAEGKFVLVDCSGNVLFRLEDTKSFHNFQPFVGKFIKIKGNVPVKDDDDPVRKLKVRSITVKSNPCSTGAQ